MDLVIPAVVLVFAGGAALLAFRRAPLEHGPRGELLHRRADALSQALDARALELEQPHEPRVK